MLWLACVPHSLLRMMAGILWLPKEVWLSGGYRKLWQPSVVDAQVDEIFCCTLLISHFFHVPRLSWKTTGYNDIRLKIKLSPNVLFTRVESPLSTHWKGFTLGWSKIVNILSFDILIVHESNILNKRKTTLWFGTVLITWLEHSGL